MSLRVETPHGVLRHLNGRHGPRWYLEVPGCPNGGLELLDDRQLHGNLSVNHAAVCSCGYHETHDFTVDATNAGLSLEQYALVKGIRERAGVAFEPKAAGPETEPQAESIKRDPSADPSLGSGR